MLTYHPIFDSHHCFFRVAALLYYSNKAAHEIDRIRIIDFYMSSPAALKSFKFPQEFRKSRKLFSDKINHYNDIPNQRSLFYELKPIQDAVFDQMLSIGVIDLTAFKAGSVALAKQVMPDELVSIIRDGESIDFDIITFAIDALIEIPLLGLNGLKHRSGLMDHRYDLA